MKDDPRIERLISLAERIITALEGDIALLKEGRTGALSPVAWEPTQGTFARFLGLDPAGRFLYNANQGSNTIVTFAVAVPPSAS